MILWTRADSQTLDIHTNLCLTVCFLALWLEQTPATVQDNSSSSICAVRHTKTRRNAMRMFALILTLTQSTAALLRHSNTNVCSGKNGMNVGHWAWAGICITDEVLSWIYHVLVLYCIIIYNACCHLKLYNEQTNTDYQPLDIQRTKNYTP